MSAGEQLDLISELGKHRIESEFAERCTWPCIREGGNVGLNGREGAGIRYFRQIGHQHVVECFLELRTMPERTASSRVTSTACYLALCHDLSMMLVDAVVWFGCTVTEGRAVSREWPLLPTQ
jgi:hypothetical protein